MKKWRKNGTVHFWEDDELDMDKKHLSQHDKRSLLYGGFMKGYRISIIKIWTNHQNQKDFS